MSKPKPYKPPPVPAPAAVPEVAAETEETAARRARRRRGYESTIMTGSLVPSARRNTVLG